MWMCVLNETWKGLETGTVHLQAQMQKGGSMGSAETIGNLWVKVLLDDLSIIN